MLLIIHLAAIFCSEKQNTQGGSNRSAISVLQNCQTEVELRELGQLGPSLCYSFFVRIPISCTTGMQLTAKHRHLHNLAISMQEIQDVEHVDVCMSRVEDQQSLRQLPKIGSTQCPAQAAAEQTSSSFSNSISITAKPSLMRRHFTKTKRRKRSCDYGSAWRTLHTPHALCALRTLRTLRGLRGARFARFVRASRTSHAFHELRPLKDLRASHASRASRALQGRVRSNPPINL